MQMELNGKTKVEGQQRIANQLLEISKSMGFPGLVSMIPILDFIDTNLKNHYLS